MKKLDNINIKIINAKTVILGDIAVGKTSIALRFTSNIYHKYNESTIGASYLTKTLTVNDNIYKFFIWDTSGEEKYHSLASMYYRGADIAIIVYDITQKQSFISVKKWIKELKDNGPVNISFAIIGNKNDLENKRQVLTKDAKKYADEMNAVFFETSAKDNVNIDELFKEMSTKISHLDHIIGYDDIIKIYSSQQKKQNYCCY
jgi:small GTP-binding protein